MINEQILKIIDEYSSSVSKLRLRLELCKLKVDYIGEALLNPVKKSVIDIFPDDIITVVNL